MPHNEKHPLRVAGYIRVSALMGREGESFHSPEVQRERIEAWAAYRGATVTGWYSDLDVSGTGKVRRPELERLTADAKHHEFDVVVVYRLDRWARSMSDAATRYRELRELGIDLVSVSEDIDTTTASGELIQNVMFAFAEFEAKRIGEGWKAIHARRRQRGLPNVTKEITGYRQPVDEATGRKRAMLAEVEPGEAEAVRAMFEMRARGATYGEIRAALHSAGHRTRTGGSYFGHSVIGQILRNPLFAGLVALPDGSLIEGQHEAIVERELWERVQATHKQVVRANRHHAALLSGLLVCSSCGYRMGHNPGGRPRGNGMIRADHYRCSSRQRKESCPRQLSVQADLADAYVERAFLGRVNLDRMPHKGRVRPRLEERAGRDLKRLHDRISEIDASLDRLTDDRFRRSKVSVREVREYERQTARFLAEREEVEEQMQEAEAFVASLVPPDWTVLDQWQIAPVGVKRRAIRRGIREIRVLPAPRRGKGQAALLPQRLEIDWIA